jgi:hypothetical protein
MGEDDDGSRVVVVDQGNGERRLVCAMDRTRIRDGCQVDPQDLVACICYSV